MILKILHIVRIILSISFLMAVGYGFIGFLVGYPLLFEEGERPLHKIQGIVVRDSTLYVGLGEYNVIQEYSLDGTYKGFKNIDADKWGFTFDIDETGRPVVFKRMYNDQMAIDTSAIKRILGDSSYKILEQLSETRIVARSAMVFTTSNSVVYSVSSDYFPKILKTDKGHNKILIEQHWLQKSLQGHFTPWLIAAMGMCCFVSLNIFHITRHVMNGASFSLAKAFADIFTISKQ